MENQNGPENNIPDLGKDVRRRIIQVIITLILTALILLVSAGDFTWTWAWAYLVADMMIIFVNFLTFKPEVIAERGRKKENVEGWDKVVSIFLLIFWILLYLVPGLDFRFGWTPPSSLWSHIAGLLVFFPGAALVSWAMVSNTFFSTAVRIQYDRGHSVADSGPYRYIRHPGYLGIIIYTLATPLIFGSAWTFIPAILSVAVIIIRTRLEDKTLKEKLGGYSEYAGRVKYRLLPYIW